MKKHKGEPVDVERITLEMANKIQDAIDSEALAWMSDKGYQLSTLEKQQEFANKRNENLRNSGND
jgi:plasmid maintenance system antidote protein VapI